VEGRAFSYTSIFLASAALSLILTPVAMAWAMRHGSLDRPGGHKGHAQPVPYLGGLAIAASFAVAVVVGGALSRPESGLDELLLVVGLALALSVVGLIDDLRGLGAVVRLVAEAAAAVALWAGAERVDLFSGDVLDLVLTVVWVVGITNAFNLLDNMDGLSAGVAAIAAGWLFVIAAANGQFLVASLAAGLAGCALGFLRSNFHPARIYMGDAGSLFLGFLLAYLGLKLRFDGPTSATFLVPIVVLGVAVFDTTMVSISRLLHHRSPFQGGRDHTSHRLVKVGIPVPAAVSLIYLAAIALGWLALVMSRIDRQSAYLLAGLIATVSVFAGLLLGHVPVYESSRRRHFAFQPAADPVDDVPVPRPAVGETVAPAAR
jgi:UDP-GlcNAc:undecaprenyl-phosphate GlcNAc-1-phosphate transferase